MQILAMRTLLLLGLAALLSGCDGLLGPNGGALRIVNATEQALLYVAYELEESHAVDPHPTLRVEEHPDRLVPPGEGAAMRVDGYSAGDAVRVFVYAVPPQDIAGPVALTRVITATSAELERAHRRVIVDEL